MQVCIRGGVRCLEGVSEIPGCLDVQCQLAPLCAAQAAVTPLGSTDGLSPASQPAERSRAVMTTSKGHEKCTEAT